jgi:rhodanese-related sulfurtransferase
MQQVTAIQLHSMMKAGDDFLLVDVREDFEHASYNIGGTLAPLSELFNQRQKFEHSKPIVIYCRKGVRSRLPIQRLEEKYGLKNLINLQGGIEAWLQYFGK